MFWRLPVWKLSQMMTEWPASSRRSVRRLPMKPAPPVMSIFIITAAPVVYGSGRNLIYINKSAFLGQIYCFFWNPGFVA